MARLPVTHTVNENVQLLLEIKISYISDEITSFTRSKENKGY